MDAKTTVAIDGARFLVNGKPTYAGADWQGRSMEGLLLNSRMIQAVFDDANAQTRTRWAYPDTGAWDPDRNTDEFCAALPTYREHGLLAVTVGLQGGGAIFEPEVNETYVNSAFTPEGELKPAFFNRLSRVLRAADDVGMVVIVNFFYWKQVAKMPSDQAVLDATARATEWLLKSGFRNVLVDVCNESARFWKRPLCEPENVHRLIEVAQSTTLDGRRLLVGVSTAGGPQLPSGRWREIEDFHMPHGNGCTPEALTAKLAALKDSAEYRANPRPVVVNEDGVAVQNLEAAVSAGSSWGFYCQGYGSDYGPWKGRPREARFEELSGFQTVPVNWSINTPVKRAFFDKVREMTGGRA